ncbi:MAG: homoserine kinase [Acidobacteriota bacterium]|nr:homoserine kinase [Acidobacteriota bacterium]
MAITAFAPATVANLGPGFDVLGLALHEPGDRVTARTAEGEGVRIVSIQGDDARLPTRAEDNTAGIAAAVTLELAGVRAGIEIELEKGLPLGSGLGSSAASAAAAAWAVNRLIGSPLMDLDLVEACLEAESAVSGRHADNVAAAVLGGIVMVRSVDPLDVVSLPVPRGLSVAVVTPEFEFPTRKAREVLPHSVSLTEMVRGQAALAGLVSALYMGDLALLGRSLEEHVITPARTPLIPGARGVMETANRAGALGSGLSGSGPSVFALCRDLESAGAVAGAMVEAYAKAGLASQVIVSPAECPGAREA